jgi:hypothetical protein
MSSFQPICTEKRVACFTLVAFVAGRRWVLRPAYLAWLMMAMSKMRSPKYLRMNIKGLAILPMT